ncbi:hypothetical protein [Metabacillus fastidiosus]|uniref:hypothetical protein n=1 Tax=Metabacillus fastidiosus TaxID=1458 RepID=UPI003D28E5B7
MTNKTNLCRALEITTLKLKGMTILLRSSEGEYETSPNRLQEDLKDLLNCINEMDDIKAF